MMLNTSGNLADWFGDIPADEKNIIDTSFRYHFGQQRLDLLDTLEMARRNMRDRLQAGIS